MKVTTKALTTVLVIAMLTVTTATGVSAFEGVSPEPKRDDKRLARVVKHHDRKMELRASVLGMTADELKEELKTRSFRQILKQHGFRSEAAFQTALAGKTKDELRRRGWSDQKIEQFINKRIDRLAKQQTERR